MKKIITNWIYKFELNFDYSIFAGALRKKIIAIHYEHLENVEIVVKKIIVANRRFWKYLNYNSRTKEFLTNLFVSFEKEHELIASMIEYKETVTDEEKYLSCKGNISAIINAKRRFNKIRNNKVEIKSFIGQYIHSKRFAIKYKLQYN